MNDRIRPADVYRETGQWIGPALVAGLNLKAGTEYYHCDLAK